MVLEMIGSPGFSVYMKQCKEVERRGVMRVKCVLMQYVTRVDKETEDNIWVELSCLPRVKPKTLQTTTVPS